MMTATTKQERIEELEAALSRAIHFVDKLDKISSCDCCSSESKKAMYYLTNVLADKLKDD